MQASPGDGELRVSGGGEGDGVDSGTPLLVRGAGRASDSQPTEVADPTKAFSNFSSKPKSGLWSKATKPAAPLLLKDPPGASDPPGANDLRQPPKELQRHQQQASSVESPVPSITLTQPTFDAIAEKGILARKDTENSGMGKSSIHFSDVVMSTLPSQASEISSYSAIEIVVFTMDNKGVSLILDDGRHTTSDVILTILLDDLKIPKKYKPCFGIWLSSPLLHLQLRPTHVPHMMAKHWPRLLRRFTLASEEQLASDEPILRLQRNAFLSPTAELKIEQPEVIRLLYCEAKENVMEGLYPVDEENCFKLSGICSVAQFGAFSEADHPRRFYKEFIGSLLPEWIEKSRFGCLGSGIIARLFARIDKVKDKLSYELQQAHRTETERVIKSRSPEDSSSLSWFAQRQFLSKCYQLPFYGCAFFRAILYKPSTILTEIWNMDRDGVKATFPIKVAVSPRGVCLLDLSTDDHLPGSMILSLPFSEMHWTVAELVDTEDEPGLMSSTSPAVLPSLFFHFLHPDRSSHSGYDGGSGADFLMLQIVSKQALLIDAFMRTCIQLNEYGLDDTPGSKGVNPDQLFGTGVEIDEFMNFDWQEEELVLRRKDQDICLSMQLDRLKLGRAEDFND